MKLLHREIEIEPGRDPQQPGLEGTVGPGSALLRLHNTTNQENAYKVELRCDSPYWQDEWYTLAAQAAAVPAGWEALERSSGARAPGAARVALPTGKPDQYGQGRRSVKVYVSAGETRDVLISFQVPQRPESRAGRYPFVVTVETFVTGGESAAGRRSPFSEIDAAAVVRPYHRWTVDLTPESGRRVGRLRRSAEFEVLVTNQGNDWLYCLLRPPRARDLLLEPSTIRLAVPPPEPGEENVQRGVPLRATTQLRNFRGERMPQQIPLSAVRIDAPSVAAQPEEGLYRVAPALGVGAVVATETTDTQPTPGDRPLIYCPPFPSTLSGFFGGILQNGKALLTLGIAFVVMLHVWAYCFEHLRYQLQAEPLTVSVNKNEKLVLGGRFLNGARVLIEGDDSVEQEVESHFGNSRAYRETSIINSAANKLLNPLRPGQRQFIELTIPERYDHQKITLYVQRLGVLPWLRPLMPKFRCTSQVQVGRLKPSGTVSQTTTISPGARRGEEFTILDPQEPFGAERGSVSVGTTLAEIIQWGEGRIQAVMPTEAQPGTRLHVVVNTADKQGIRLADPIEVLADAPGTSATILEHDGTSSPPADAKKTNKTGPVVEIRPSTSPREGSRPRTAGVPKGAGRTATAPDHAIAPKSMTIKRSTADRIPIQDTDQRPANDVPLAQPPWNGSPYDLVIFGEYRRAEDACQSAGGDATISAEDAIAQATLAYAHSREGRPRRDIQSRAESMARQARSGRALALVSMTKGYNNFQVLRHRAQERAFYADAARTDPTLLIAYTGLAESFRADGDEKSAAQWLERAIKQVEKYPQMQTAAHYYELARCCTQLGNSAAAQKYLTQAKEQDPSIADLRAVQALEANTSRTSATETFSRVSELSTVMSDVR
jgi:tetratricopeptide (TPR) repeat protein